VVPSPQRATAVRLAYGARQLSSDLRVWSTPDVLPWGAWLARSLDEARGRGLTVPRRLSNAEQWSLWSEAVNTACEQELEVLHPEGLVEAVRRSRQLLEDYGREAPDVGSPETTVLLRAGAHFRARCDALRALTASSWRDCSPYVEVRRPTRLAGFSQIGAARRAWLERLGVAIDTDPELNATPIRPTTVRALADPEREASAAAQWCAEWLERDPTARLLLVVPHLDEQRHRWQRALSQRLDYDAILAAGTVEPGNVVAFEGGRPLADYALVQLALRLLALAVGQGDFAGLSAVLRSPYLPAAGREARLRFELWLRERNVELQGIPSVSLCDVAARQLGRSTTDALRPLWRALEPATDLLTPSMVPAGDWARRFAEVLERCQWPGDSLTSEEQQTRIRFEELLGELASIAIGPRPLRAAQALALLQQLAVRTAFAPATDDVPVTVTADLNDPIVRYDGIWVAGLSAERWPQPLRPDPLIPWALQRAAAMPEADPDAPLVAAERALRQWRRAGGELVLSYAASDADLQHEPSSLLSAVGSAAPEPRETCATEFELESWLAGCAPRLETVPDLAGSSWPAGETPPGGTRLLELQALCPFHAFAELRLAAEPLREPAPGIDPALRGQILHDALELFWQRLANAVTLHERKAELLDMARDCIDAALREANRRQPGGIDRQLLRHEGARDQRLFEMLIEWELARAPFEVEALEHSQQFALGPAALRLRVDRLDRLPDGRVIVFDYKTGKAEPFDALAERLRRPQLPAYAIATGQRTAAVAALYLTRQGPKLRGVADREGRLRELKAPKPGTPDWSVLQQRWRERLAALAQEFVRGHAAVDPLPDACDYCHLRTLCRVQLAPATEPTEVAPEDAPWMP
jgi:probable DNA repair protein